MSALTITHTHADGTLIDGTARRADTAQIDRTAAALRADGFDVDITIDDTYRTTAEVEADKIDRQGARVDALAAKPESTERSAA